MACVMRVLAKPELDNHIVLNELVVIMENFGVIDQQDEDDVDDYVPDTETESSVIHDKPDGGEAEEKGGSPGKEKKAGAEDDEQEKSGKDAVAGKKKEHKKRSYDLRNVSEKGVKILRKLARFLLK